MWESPLSFPDFIKDMWLLHIWDGWMNMVAATPHPHPPHPRSYKTFWKKMDAPTIFTTITQYKQVNKWSVFPWKLNSAQVKRYLILV